MYTSHLTTEQQQAPPEIEQLSQTARRLAARLAGLIERTMNLCDLELAQAEAQAATPQPTPNPDTRNPIPDSRPQPKPRTPKPATRTPASSVGHLKTLVHAFESLIRAARTARAIEEAERNAIGSARPTAESLREFMESEFYRRDEKVEEKEAGAAEKQDEAEVEVQNAPQPSPATSHPERQLPGPGTPSPKNRAPPW